jgi:hypothetical protein
MTRVSKTPHPGGTHPQIPEVPESVVELSDKAQKVAKSVISSKAHGKPHNHHHKIDEKRVTYPAPDNLTKF